MRIAIAAQSLLGLVILAGCGPALDAGDEDEVSDSHVSAQSTTTCSAADQVVATQLLEDPVMSNGAQYGWGTIQGEPAERCQKQYVDRGISPTKSRWRMVEVCEDNCFCENTVNPIVTQNSVTYGNNYKQLTVDKAARTVEIFVDTSKEWREGCNLSLPTGPAETPAGASPDHAEANKEWNWNHLLLSQTFSPALKLAGEGAYDKISYKGDFKLKDAFKTMATPCLGKNPTDFDLPHAIVYLAFTVDRMDGPTDKITRAYALVRLWSTQNGTEFGADQMAPWFGPAEARAYTYMARAGGTLGATPLAPDDTFHAYDINLKQLAREALASYSQANEAPVDPAHFAITSVFWGYEVWGGYTFSVTSRNQGVTGYVHTSSQCVSWNEFWSPAEADHRYEAEESIGGYVKKGYLGRAPRVEAPGRTALYRYRSEVLSDYYYSAAQLPLGAGCANGTCHWSYEGEVGYVWPNPGAGRIPIYGFWCAATADNKLGRVVTPDEGCIGNGIQFYLEP